MSTVNCSTSLAPLAIPNEEAHWFTDSPFFSDKSLDDLPSPKDVRQRFLAEGSDPWHLSSTLKYPGLGLLVKFGRDITKEEGQCLFFVRRQLGDKLRVPEIYGWTRDGREGFLYMELIQGSTLLAEWPRLNEEEKFDICQELSKSLGALRRLRQVEGESFIGNVSRSNVHDSILEVYSNQPWPFPTAKEFNDYFATLAGNWPKFNRDLRLCLSDTLPITFTHGDLHRSNILVTPTHDGRPATFVAIIDWHQSGWLPAYWEYCKAQWTARKTEEWSTTYLRMIVSPPETSEYQAFMRFACMLGV